MPRPPKANKDKVAVPLPVMPAPRAVEVENFIRVRDSTLGRLKTIQQLIKSFADDYLRQTNLLLGLPTTAEDLSYHEPLVNLEASLAALGSIPAPQPVAPPQEEQKKERKKRTLDPNAPKRPLTPYFLYMQTARPIIAADLGSGAPKRAVQEEGQRRWATMGASEKQGWNQAYQYNLRLYNARVHSYKSGNAEAKNMDDTEALKYADEFNIPIPSNDDQAGNEQDAIAEQLKGTSADAHGEVDDGPPTAKSAKKSGPGRKRKTADAPEEADATPRAPATPASPAQKRRRTSSKPTEEEPKKSGRKKAGKNA
ncbi:hypothetical protein jhhlp_001035 [Lomentospora prolificans]|uniref:HMG box domain-containing protein n=1 Tax=Lomentospora prolificans TaxID=41688 RepID=A0A2N3NK60_9PEZI|nr:hypothetical protein jhhlp_001035 [Lomentospora prolificans]